MTFSISLLTVLRRIIGLKALGESYDFLLGLGIMIVVDLLKCKGQYFDTSISNADNDIETIIIFENSFQVTPQQLIRARSG